MLLFENNMLLFSLLFSENFSGGDKALMEGDKVVMGRFPQSHPPPPQLGKTLLGKVLMSK